MNTPSLGPLVLFVGIALVGAFLVTYGPVVERRVVMCFHVLLPRWPLAAYYVFFVGTCVHELSHAAACVVLGVPVRSVSLFHPRPDGSGGWVLGQVSYSACGPVRCTLIGLAPTFGCAGVSFATFLWVTPVHTIGGSWAAVLERLSWLPAHLSHWQVLVFVYVAVACAISGNPSTTDLRRLPVFLGVMGVLGVGGFAMRAWFERIALPAGLMVSADAILADLLIVLLFQSAVLGAVHVVAVTFMRLAGYRYRAT
jgi:hypothetical protein